MLEAAFTMKTEILYFQDNIVYKNKLYHSGGNNNYTITTDPNKINTGLYTLLIVGANNEKIIHLPLMINK